MNLKSLRDISLVVTAGSNEAEVFGEQCFNGVFDKIAPSGGGGVQHLPESTAIMPLVQEDFQRHAPCREVADAIPSVGGIRLVLFASQTRGSLAKQLTIHHLDNGTAAMAAC